MNKLSAFSLSLILVFLLAHNASSGDLSHVYSTGRMMEVDRCASAWLIKRHIDTEAEFVFLKTAS